MPAIIGLVGHLAAGKGTAAAYLRERHGAAAVRFSDVFREALALFDLEITRQNQQELSTIMRRHFGEDVLARAVAKKAQQLSAELAVVDGVRRLTDIQNLLELPQFHLVAIAADQQTRYRRCVSRNENQGDDRMTFEQFQQRDAAEAEAQIPKVIERAEFTVDNGGTVEQLYAELDRIVASL